MNNIFVRIKELNKALSSLPGIISPARQENLVYDKNDLFDELITDPGLKRVIQRLFKDGHHARAVEEAYKYIDNIVKRLAKPENVGLTGAKLMSFALNPSAPVIKLNSGLTASENDEQNGYMQIFSGCMIGIRNPRAHECEWEDSEQRALQLLMIANHLVERIRLAECNPVLSSKSSASGE